MYYQNLQKIQKMYGYTNKQVASYLGIGNNIYIKKLYTGKFTCYECKLLCMLYNKSFNFLFK